MHTTSFKIKEVSESVVLKILQNLNPSKATGLDQLSPSLIKDGANIIMSPLTHLFLVTGQIPDDLKSSRVTSIYKKNPSKTEAGNYCPVSILNIISKLFETVVYHQLDQYPKTINSFMRINPVFVQPFQLIPVWYIFLII